jgi:hypothetical protein
MCLALLMLVHGLTLLLAGDTDELIRRRARRL